MPNVLILGSGMVSPPLIRHLLAQPGYKVTVGDIAPDRAQKIVGGNPNGSVIQLDASDLAAVSKEIPNADVVVSILPFQCHPSIAKLCLEHNRHFLTASYGKSMKHLDADAKAKGLVFLNEMGLDPGIDHMSALQIIDKAHSDGGKINSFTSFCGALPSPEANTNPFGYKFSWAPKGILVATGYDATYKKDGKVIKVPNALLFQNPTQHNFEGIGTLEGYPNRDSLEFIDDYRIPETRTMLRGTLRYPGWCQFWDKVTKTGILSEAPLDTEAGTVAEFTARLIGATTASSLEAAFAQAIGVGIDSKVIDMARWLGLFSEEKIPIEEWLKLYPGKGFPNTPIDTLLCLTLKNWKYSPGERDMSVLHHVFEVEYPEKGARITSTLVEYGIPYGDTSMARTVGLTAAIGVKLIIEEKIHGRGVLRPTSPDIYNSALAELASLGISMQEKTDSWPIRNF